MHARPASGLRRWPAAPGGRRHGAVRREAKNASSVLALQGSDAALRAPAPWSKFLAVDVGKAIPVIDPRANGSAFGADIWTGLLAGAAVRTCASYAAGLEQRWRSWAAP